MKQFLLSVCTLLVVGFASAQASDTTAMLAKAGTANDTIDGWKYSGTGSFLLNQNSFSNWNAGGVNSTSGNLSGAFSANMKDGKKVWDNSLIVGYGLNKVDGNEKAQKTDDRIELNSTYGYNFKSNWYYVGAASFRTQFTDGFDYANDPLAENAISSFMAPGYLNFGAGVQYRKSDKFWISLLPANAKMTFVTDDNIDETFFGLDAGKSSLFQLGFQASALYETELMKNVIWSNRLSLFSNYLENPQNIDINYDLGLNLKVNDYLTTSLNFSFIYDDDILLNKEDGTVGPGLQFRQMLGVGLSYNFF